MADPRSPEGFENLLSSIEQQAAYPLNAVIPEVRISAMREADQEKMGPSVKAGVRSDDPSNIQINTSAPQNMSQILMHEFEHVLQNNVAKRYGTSYDRQVVDEAKKLGLTVRDITSSLERAGASKKLRSHLEKMGATPSAYLGGVPDGGMSLQEQWADLSAIEQQLKKDLTQDPVVRKEMFNDNDKLVQLYKGTTGLRTNRLDAKDLPPMTAGPNITPQGPATMRAPATPGAPPASFSPMLDKVLQMFKNPFPAPPK